MRKLAIEAALVCCIFWLSVVHAAETDNVPIYSQKEYKSGYNAAATLGANVGLWCMAQHPITRKTKSAEDYLEKINKCIEDKLRERGVTFIRDDR